MLNRVFKFYSHYALYVILIYIYRVAHISMHYLMTLPHQVHVTSISFNET